jgi:hypothetical protein
MSGDLGWVVLPARQEGGRSQVTTTSTSICSSEPGGAELAVGGREVSFGQDPPAAGQWSLRQSVRVFRAEGARAQLDWLTANLTTCHGGWSLTGASVEGVVADQAVLAYQVGAEAADPGGVVVIGAVRQGRTTAGVCLYVPASAAGGQSDRVDVALDHARRLLNLASTRLVASGLAPAAAAESG